jgi:competence protein ComEA
MRLAARQALRGFAPSRLNIRALVVVAVLVVVGAGWLVWYEQPRAEPVAPAPSSYNAPSAGAAGSPAGMIVVAVEGKVQRPGLVRLPSGSRVADAITAAGGVLPGVDVSNLNLARKLTDGELILVAEAPPPGSTVAASDPAGGGKVDLNTATVSQLDALPGIGPELAQRIIDYRTQHGGFRSVDQLQQVTGIGDAKYAEIKDLVTV